MGIARHKIEDYYRRRINEVEISEDDEYAPELASMSGLEEHMDSAALQEKVRRVLSRMPEAYTVALIWRYKDEKTIREMARHAGKSEKAMERLLARARDNFRRRWSDAGL